MKSNFLNLNLSDFVKGLILAVISAVLMAVYNVLKEGGSITSIDWKMMLNVAILAFISYLTKNLFTNEKDKFLKKTTKK